jgi:hypothetical protein
MRVLRLNAIAALMAATMAACGGGGGSDPIAGAPSPAPVPVPAPAPAPAPVPVPPPPPSPLAPLNTLNSGSANIRTSATLTFNGANGNPLIIVDDPDSASLTVFLTLNAGTLTMAPGSGAMITGDGSSAVVIEGTKPQINAALSGMVYTAPINAQSVRLQIVSQDGTTPTPLSDTDEFTIAVTVAPPPEFKTFQSASAVLGQANFTSGASGPAHERNVASPRGAVALSDSGSIYVPDAGHNRVIVFPAGAGAGDSADFVLGQPTPFDQNAEIDQGRHPQAAHVAIFPSGVGRMAVAEPSANRVSLYHVLPTANSSLPTALLGQDNFTDSAPGCFARRLNAPQGVTIFPTGSRLVVADTGNNRVNVYNAFTPPGQPSLPLNLVLGQGSTDECVPNRGGSPDLGTMNQPTGVWTDGTRLVVADTGNNRVLIWHSFPTLSNPVTLEGEPPDRVLGQDDFVSVLPNRGAATPGAARMNAPTHVASDGTRLAVADTGNNRVLIWTTFPTTNGALAHVVLGQNSFIRRVPNDADQNGTTDGPSGEVFSSPTGLFFHEGKLYVSDRDNNRVLIFEPQLQ